MKKLDTTVTLKISQKQKEKFDKAAKKVERSLSSFMRLSSEKEANLVLEK